MTIGLVSCRGCGFDAGFFRFEMERRFDRDVEYYLNVEKYEKKWILSFFIDCRGKCFLRRDKRIIKDR